MKNKLVINGTDVYEAFGVFIAKSGYNGLIQYPPSKPVAHTDWPELNGIDADLTGLKLAGKDFQIPFCSDNIYLMDMFLDFISEKLYYTFEFKELNRVYVLRLTNQNNLQALRGLGKFSLSFTDESPLKDYSYIPPTPLPVKQRGYKLDNKDLSEYGLYVLKGSDEAILKRPGVKDSMVIDAQNDEERLGDKSRIFFKEKDVEIKLLMEAPDINTFWKNYNAFMYRLINKPEGDQPEGEYGEAQRVLAVEKFGMEFPCYYKSSGVSRFQIIKDKVWCEFSVVLVFLSFSHGIDKDVLLSVTPDEIHFDCEGGTQIIRVRSLMNWVIK